MKKNTMILLVSFMILLASVAHSEDVDYFPMRQGLTRHYQAVYRADGRETPVITSIFVLPNKNLNGQDVAVLRFTMSLGESANEDHSYSFLVRSEEGIKEVAEQSFGDSTPKLRDKDKWEVKFPITVGTSWTVDVDKGEGADKFSIPVTYTIESMDEVVTVPAGTFKRCMKIRGYFRGKVNLGSYGGTLEITQETYSYHAPGVGLIKEQYLYKTSNPGSCEISTELTSLKG